MLITHGVLLSQQNVRVLSYDVRAVIDDRTSEIAGNAFIRLIPAAMDSAAVSFLVPSAWDINSTRDKNNDSYDTDRSPSGRRNFYRIVLEGTEERNANDTLIVNIEFKAEVDSSAMSDLFINPAEFLLPYSDSASWLPLFGPGAVEHASLEISCSPAFIMFSDRAFDTTTSEGIRTWKMNCAGPAPLSSLFTLCGIRDPVRQISYTSDSAHSVSFYSSPAQFDQRYAAAITRQLTDAIRFFASVTGQQHLASVTYAIVGGATFEPEIFHTDDFIIHRNSPVFGVLDSSALNRSQYNHWLFETAQHFCPKTEDSTALFDDGFAAYLSMRYLASVYPHLIQQERVTAIAHALTFFPSGPIAAGHHSPGNTNEIISYRGRYCFIMLEYLLGTEAFDSVLTKMCRTFSETHISFSAFQSLCEEEYGSPLDWFFAQWLYRAAAPEFVIQWKQEKTPRGMTVVSVTVEQRGELFAMPVPLVFTFGAKTVTKRILAEQMKQEFLFTFPSPPTAVELDPDHVILRWLLEIRISAHARTSLQYLSVSHDLSSAEREAHYTLQLDPNNSTGSAPLLYFVLGNSAAASNNLDKGKEYFLKAMSSDGSAATEKYKLLSLVQYANILEMEGSRDEAVTLYRRAITEGMNNPLLYERAIIKAEMHLRGSINSRTDAWFELH